MANDVLSRMGDSSRYYTNRKDIVDEIWDGTADAADATNVPEMTADDVEALADIMCAPERTVGVLPGKEVVFTEDACITCMFTDNGNCGNGIDLGRLDASLVMERCMGMDSLELAINDYSVKAVKPLIANEVQALEEMNMLMTLPYFYGSMTNLGIYYAPDGPWGNPADLMRELKIDEAREAAEGAANQMANDIVYVTTQLMNAGAEGYNFDTIGSAGDADFYGALVGVQEMRKRFPDVYINMGMSAENVLGIHGELEFDGKLLAGMYPNEQNKMCEKVGANSFGCVINTNTSKTSAWNIARAVTISKDCVKHSNIPVHVNQGMGVGGVPMCECPPIDILSRANKACVELAHVDGI